jgi:hypothetical protein
MERAVLQSLHTQPSISSIPYIPSVSPRLGMANITRMYLTRMNSLYNRYIIILTIFDLKFDLYFTLYFTYILPYILPIIVYLYFTLS